jgi:cell cycle checkpoint protein
MSSSTTSGRGDDAPDLVCVLDCVQGMVDALSCVRWKRHQVSQASPFLPTL